MTLNCASVLSNAASTVSSVVVSSPHQAVGSPVAATPTSIAFRRACPISLTTSTESSSWTVSL